jgi:outer membrane protein OmpA-like peptidoglycan-associated protein
MKRLNLFFGAAALIAVSLTASPALMAQEDGNRDENGKIVRGPYETNRFGDNWFISVGGGINSYWNEGMTVDNMKIAPSIDANFGKWFTPSVGMRAGYQGINFQMTPGDLEKFGYMYFHGDFLWNISNAFSGYKETRFWNFVPYLHAGYFRSYDPGDTDFADDEIAAGAGLLHNLRLSNRLDLVIDMRATVVNGRVSASDGISVLPSVTMGLAVDLGWPNFVRASTVIGAVETAAAENMAVLETAALALEMANVALEEQNAELASANKKLKKENASLKTSVVNTDVLFKDMGPATLYFNIGEAVLCEKELHHLDFIATNLLAKVDKDTKIYITLLGTADGTTGSMKRNQHLSKARGEYIYSLLTQKYNITPSRIIIQSEVVESPADPALSRSVVIKF